MAEQMLTPAEAGQRLRVSAKTIYRHVHAGRLSAIASGTGKKRPHVRIPESALDAFVKAEQL